MRVLFVEDEPDLTAVAVPYLKAEGFLVDPVETLSEAVAAIASFSYDSILLDRHLSDGDGLTLMRDLRRDGNGVPIIVMSAALRSLEERVAGLVAGADDYVCKPLALSELVARLHCILRRPREINSQWTRIGNLAFDVCGREARVDDRPLTLARREIGVLERLVQSYGRVVSRAQIEEAVYGFNDEVTYNAVDVSLYRLRSALKAAACTATIRTMRGMGYVLTDEMEK